MHKTAAIQTLFLPMPLGMALISAISSYCHRAYYYYGYYYRRSYRALFGNHSDNIS